MHTIKRVFVVVFLVTVAAAQTQESLLSESRLTIHTLVREDIFAGFLTDDMERFSRGEKNIELLLEKRPAAKASLLAWKGGTMLYRAVRAHEANRGGEFQQYYKQAVDLFAEARQLDPKDDGVAAVTGGSYVIFADRLPKEHRAAAWSTAYDAFQQLWRHQSAFVDKLPVHIRGELLGGLAISSQRTGRTEETAQYLDKILAVLSNTPYEPVAKQWKKDPQAANSTSITCLSCHDAGRLSARVAAINGK